MAADEAMQIILDGNRAEIYRATAPLIRPLFAGNAFTAPAFIMVSPELGNGNRRRREIQNLYLHGALSHRLQIARFMREKPVYNQALDYFALPDPLLFSLLLGICIVIVLLVIRLGSKLFGVVDDDPIVGKLSPMVPILIPMAFTGELVYRMAHFAEGVGDFIPTIGRFGSAS